MDEINIKMDRLTVPRTTEIDIPKIIDCALTCIALKNDDLVGMIIDDLLPPIAMSDIRQFAEVIGYGNLLYAAEAKQAQMDTFIDIVKDYGKWIPEHNDLLGM